MGLPTLAASDPARHEQARLGAAAVEAVAATHAVDLGLDDPRGAGAAFASIADAAATLPLPGPGRTAARLAGLATVAAVDVTLGRLVEAHTDALAILAELDGAPPARGQRWGVWAAEGPGATTEAGPAPSGYALDGMKPWCSGAALCTHALVTAAGPAGQALYAVALDPACATPQYGSWQAVGLSGSGSERVTFTAAPATAVGAPGSYLTRPGFWHGAVGVAAVWWGAATGIAAPLYTAAEAGRANPHALAHLGAVEAALASSAALLREAAAAIDAQPAQVGERWAFTVRAAVEAAATEVIARVGRALGPAPLCLDRAHARRVADLTVYVRQSHAERDLERLGVLTGDRP